MYDNCLIAGWNLPFYGQIAFYKNIILAKMFNHSKMFNHRISTLPLWITTVCLNFLRLCLLEKKNWK